MPFAWLHRAPAGSDRADRPAGSDRASGPPSPQRADRRVEAARSELASRAGVLYRLGFSQAATSQRLAAAVAWEYDTGSPHSALRRPDALSDQAIAQIVSETYARRPG
jgi:hypothetical protein